MRAAARMIVVVVAILAMPSFLFAAPAGTARGEEMTKEHSKPIAEALKSKLTPEQYRVTQQCGTEPPFNNPYWDNKKPGIYVDIVTGEPLFSSLAKYDSGTGWPSFFEPIEKENVVSKPDADGSGRTEVRSRSGDSHLGHVFGDGPGPSGRRFCINSAALRFVPVEKMKDEGYGKYLTLFDGPAKAEVKPKPEKATLAGGCFWGVEEILRKTPGVISTRVGYAGGKTKMPTYEAVKRGDTGHAESIEVTFDPATIGYEQLLDLFFRLHDPTTLNRQGGDAGTQYRSVVFYHTESQRRAAERAKEKAEKSGRWGGRKVITEIVQAGTFNQAEDYHQKYLEKNPGGYTCHYLRD